MFFSVPYDEGWSATVNGQPAQIEKVDIGFMAVRAPAGDSTIRFTYRTPGLGVGLLASGISLAVLAGYLLLSHQLAPAACAIDFLYRTANAGGRTSAFF